MARTLSDILKDINSVIDLETAEPTGSELDTRVNYANQAVWDASASGQLSEFKQEFISLATGATISLPSNFREPHENPRLMDSSGNWQEYEVVEVEQKYDKTDNDNYVYIMGNPSAGYNMYVNNLITNATLSFIYQRYPTGLATLTDTCELSDPQYVVRAVEAYILYSRSDDRFPIAEQKANRQLLNMMGREMKGTTGGARKTTMTFKNPLSKEA